MQLVVETVVMDTLGWIWAIRAFLDQMQTALPASELQEREALKQIAREAGWDESDHDAEESEIDSKFAYWLPRVIAYSCVSLLHRAIGPVPASERARTADAGARGSRATIGTPARPSCLTWWQRPLAYAATADRAPARCVVVAHAPGARRLRRDSDVATASLIEVWIEHGLRRLLQGLHGSCCIERELELIQLELSTGAPEVLLKAREVMRCDADSLSSARRRS